MSGTLPVSAMKGMSPAVNGEHKKLAMKAYEDSATLPHCQLESLWEHHHVPDCANCLCPHDRKNLCGSGRRDQIGSRRTVMTSNAKNCVNCNNSESNPDRHIDAHCVGN